MDTLARKMLGIIGGMGALAGAKFFQTIVEHTEAKKETPAAPAQRLFPYFRQTGTTRLYFFAAEHAPTARSCPQPPLTPSQVYFPQCFFVTFPPFSLSVGGRVPFPFPHIAPHIPLTPAPVPRAAFFTPIFSTQPLFSPISIAHCAPSGHSTPFSHRCRFVNPRFV